MDFLARLGLMATCVIAIYVGARTLWIWRRTRMVAELCIGTNVLAIAAGGLVLTVLGALDAGGAARPSAVWLALGLFGLVVHVAALYAGTWKIFRAHDRWPLVAVALATGLAGVWMLWSLASAGTTESIAGRSLLMLALRSVGLMWAGFECFRYSAMLRKRVAVGLGDPLIAHRIWLWGVSAAAGWVPIGLDIASWIAADQSLAATAGGLHMMSSFGLVSVVALALAFFPPAAYVRMIEGRYAGSPASA